MSGPGTRVRPAPVSRNPATWTKHLIWVEYAHNTLPCSSTGLSHPFSAAFGYQPPLFQPLEEEVQSAPGWRTTVKTPATSYQTDQKVWLSTQHLPLYVESCKLAPHFVGQLSVSKVTNPVTVRLIHVQPVKDSSLVWVSVFPSLFASLSQYLVYSIPFFPCEFLVTTQFLVFLTLI